MGLQSFLFSGWKSPRLVKDPQHESSGIEGEDVAVSGTAVSPRYSPEANAKRREAQAANWQAGRYARRRGHVIWWPEMVATALAGEAAGWSVWRISRKIGVHPTTYRYWRMRTQQQ